MSRSLEREAAAFLPLNPVVFRILMVLTEGERHGYSIVKQVEAESGGTLSIEPGNLYRSLRKLLAEGVIRESPRQVDPDSEDARRRYFTLTALGERVVRAEAARLERLISDARARDLLPEPGTAEGLQ